VRFKRNEMTKAPTTPPDIIERLRLCQTRRKLTDDVEAAVKDAIVEIQLLRAELDEAHQQPAKIGKAAKRGKGSASK
jgi:hypothetical protein